MQAMLVGNSEAGITAARDSLLTGAQIRQYAQLDDYQYFAEKQAVSDSKIMEFLGWVISNILEGIAWTINNDLATIFVILVAIFILYRYVVINFNFSGLTIASPEDVEANGIDIRTEDFPNIDFSQLIRQNMDNGNYRLALRYILLKSIQLLHHHKIVYFSEHKTINDYRLELRRHPQKDDMNWLFTAFELVWFGKREARLETIEKALALSNNLKKQNGNHEV
jgi:hypothetical protein